MFPHGLPPQLPVLGILPAGRGRVYVQVRLDLASLGAIPGVDNRTRVVPEV